MPDTPTPHDRLFIKVFSIADNAAAFLRIFLSDMFQQNLDFTTLTVTCTAHISNHLEKRTSDVVFSVRTAQNDFELAFLLEHKSYVEPSIEIQMQRYLLRINEQDYSEKRLIRPVIPIVFYHGSEKWKCHTPFPPSLAKIAEIEALRSRQTYLFFDTSNWSLADRRNRKVAHNVYPLSAMHLMKNVCTNDVSMVSSMIEYWQKTGREPSKSQKIVLFYYILSTTDIELEQIQNVLNRYRDDNGGSIMTTAERLRKEGEQRGIEKGEKRQTLYFAKKLLADGHDITYVARLTELPVEEVKKLNGSSSS